MNRKPKILGGDSEPQTEKSKGEGLYMNRKPKILGEVAKPQNEIKKILNKIFKKIHYLLLICKILLKN